VSLFLKLDIAKAFDTVRWDYGLPIGGHGAYGFWTFGTRWRGWISNLFFAATSSVLINGAQTRKFRDWTGL